MAQPYVSKDPLVFVKDNQGGEFICRRSELRDVKSATAEELAGCVDSGSVAYDPSN